jgi:hypothetical protein
LYFAGDTNTGIYSPGADQVAISTNGTVRLFVDSNGNVGVGGVASANGLLRLNAGSGSNANLVFSENNTERYLIGQVTGDNAFRVFDLVASSERMRIDSSGRVGIGVTDPGSPLEVQSNSGGTGIQIRGRATANTGTLRFFANNGTTQQAKFEVSDNTLEIGSLTSVPLLLITNGSERLRVTSAGNVGIGTTSPQQALHVLTAGGTSGAIQLGGSTYYGIIEHEAGVTGANIYTVATASGGGHIFKRGSTEQMRITSAGNVGIGTTSPGYLLNLVGSTPSIAVQDSGANGTRALIEATNNAVYFGNTYSSTGIPIIFSQGGASGGTERARIDSSGRLLVGTSSSPTVGDPQYGLIRVQGNTSTASGFGLLSIGRGQAAASITSGSELGHIYYTANDGSPYASVSAYSDGTSGSGDYPGRLTFSTTASGAASPTERMRIASNGAVLIGATSFAGIGLSLSSPEGSGMWSRTSSSGGINHIRFENPNGVVGGISTNASATTYSTSSDYRLKENLVPLTGAIDRLQQIPVHRFNFIADPDNTVDGFIAHEAQAVVPECVTGEKDAVDADGKPQYQGIDQSKLVPLLTAALQEAIGRIESLEAEVAQLKVA